MRIAWAALVLGLGLAGCQSHDSYLEPSKPVDKMSPEELCAYYAHYRENPDLNAHARDVATQQMRAKNCPT